MAFYYDLLLCIHFSYHCDENERRRMRDRIKSTSAVLFASSCHNFLPSLWGCWECRDFSGWSRVETVLRPASHPWCIMLFPQKTHQSMSCYHLFSILKKHNYFGLSYVIIYFPCNTAYSLGYSHTMLYHVVPHFQTTAVFFVTEIDIIWGWSTGVVLWLGPRMPWNDTSQLACGMWKRGCLRGRSRPKIYELVAKPCTKHIYI